MRSSGGRRPRRAEDRARRINLVTSLEGCNDQITKKDQLHFATETALPYYLMYKMNVIAIFFSFLFTSSLLLRPCKDNEIPNFETTL